MASAAQHLRVIPVLLMTGAIITAASLPGKYQPALLHNGIDKYAHALIYGMLAASYLFAFGARLIRRFPVRISLVTLIICLAYAVLEEIYQSIIPGRRADIVDLEADMIGVLLVTLVWLAILLKKNNRPPNTE
ncbi:MAG: hypothetical protein C0613_06575 [Desulfobulbaceae bacterium]|nr:MAG: hypothetical protein C0613_06575 [Desulfobulbaceae bacterium]